MTKKRTHSLPSRLAAALGMGLLVALINGGPSIALFFLMWRVGGDENASLALLIASLIGLLWMGSAGMKISWRLMRRFRLAYWGDDIGNLKD